MRIALVYPLQPAPAPSATTATHRGQPGRVRTTWSCRAEQGEEAPRACDSRSSACGSPRDDFLDSLDDFDFLVCNLGDAWPTIADHD